MKNQRYLTKSRFKIAAECPTKLFYTGKPHLYRNLKQEDSFLAMLADGGFQVGELAKCFYPTGIQISSQHNSEAEAETLELLKRDQVVVFEAAIRFNDYFIRVDILVKDGDHFQLIEVKAKSYNPGNPQIVGASGQLLSGMRTYVEDVAFQAYVMQSFRPNAKLRCFLMMPNKSERATVSGLNQLFKIERYNGRTKVTASPHAKQIVQAADVKNLLALVPVDEYVNKVMTEGVKYLNFKAPLQELANTWSVSYKADEKIKPLPTKACGQCEFQTRTGDLDNLKNGLHECWAQAFNFSETDFEKGTVLDLFRFGGKDKLLSEGRASLLSVRVDDINAKNEGEHLSQSERQHFQRFGIPKSEDRNGFWIADVLMSREMSAWKYPFHFIDFETSTVAIPFHTGMRPYEAVAFQFSHHVMYADGQVVHTTEFLQTDPVVFPNFEFARALREALRGDEGTVFMWSPHENTILESITRQLEDALEGQRFILPIDAAELIEFLRTLTKDGSRAMYDLCALSRKAYFHKDTKGSSSIKKVLPAVMKSSSLLKEIYSAKVYGSTIPSLNFKDFAWWVPGAGGVPLEPYELLLRYGADLLGEEVKAGEDPDELVIAEGGAAATAYARLQFEEVDAVNRTKIREALLRYCELDTLAMVMIVQAWQEFLK